MKIFELEQAIMQSWQTSEDLRVYFEAFYEEEMDKDQIANFLLGLEVLHNARSEKVFRLFEDVVREYWASKK